MAATATLTAPVTPGPLTATPSTAKAAVADIGDTDSNTGQQREHQRHRLTTMTAAAKKQDYYLLRATPTAATSATPLAADRDRAWQQKKKHRKTQVNSKSNSDSQQWLQQHCQAEPAATADSSNTSNCGDSSY